MFCHVVTQTKLFQKVVQFTAIVVYLGESIITSWNLFLDGKTCQKCRPRLQALKERALALTEHNVYTQRHVYWAHINLYINVGKSKLKLWHPRAIAAAINAIIENGGDLTYHWVHQTDDGNDIFSPPIYVRRLHKTNGSVLHWRGLMVSIPIRILAQWHWHPSYILFLWRRPQQIWTYQAVQTNHWTLDRR